MTTIEKLETQIKELKGGKSLKVLKSESPKTYYKVQNLSSELSYEKAVAKNQFVTKEHLTEFKGLIIWLLKNKCNFNNVLNLKEAMQSILDEVESQKVVFITEKGIKGIISNLTISKGLDTCFGNMVDAYQIDLSRQNTMNCKILSDYQTYKLNTLM